VRFAHAWCASHLTISAAASQPFDGNAVVSSLVQLIADPYFRTTSGFLILLQKEWVSMGHPWPARLGHDNPSGNGDVWIIGSQEPVFLAFLDCVWQLLQQNRTRFEFTEALLVVLYDSCLSLRFGEFLFRSEQEREKTRIYEQSESLFTTIRTLAGTSTQHRNVWYDPAANPRALSACSYMSSMRFWYAMYLRWNPDFSSSLETNGEEALALLRHASQHPTVLARCSEPLTPSKAAMSQKQPRNERTLETLLGEQTFLVADVVNKSAGAQAVTPELHFSWGTPSSTASDEQPARGSVAAAGEDAVPSKDRSAPLDEPFEMDP
jgi:hypothetical protein